jgi:adenosylhomocysteine nucleosidase
VATDMPEKRIAIIAAMEREVGSLIRSWKVRTMEDGDRRYRLFENGVTTLICGGIGAEAARRATEALIREVKPARIISVGFAGALDRSLRVGDVLQPRTVINAADGVRTEIESGQGVLVSSATVANKEQKIRFARTYGAGAVDMEAAAVAQGARARGVEFGALKAISDAADFILPAMEGTMDRFVSPDGRFRSVRFAGHVALRPWLWVTTIALARNSSKASRALCVALMSYLDRNTLGGQGLSDESSVSNLNQTNLDQPIEGKYASAHTDTNAAPHTQGTGK